MLIQTADKQTVDGSMTLSAFGDSMTLGGSPYIANATGYKLINGGVGGETSTQIKTRFLAATAQRPNATLIWAGTNNPTAVSTVLADIADMAAAMTHDRWCVLSVNQNAVFPSGTPTYNDVMAINAGLAAGYPGHYLDVRSYLVSQYNPAIPQDVIDHANDVVPSSLRADTIHLNVAGQTKLADYIAANREAVEGDGADYLPACRVPELFTSPNPLGQSAPNTGRFTDLRASVLVVGGQPLPPDGPAFPNTWNGPYGLGIENASPIRRLIVGDGTGYKLTIAKRVGGVTTDLISLTDSGAIEGNNFRVTGVASFGAVNSIATGLPSTWNGNYGLGFEHVGAVSRLYVGDGSGYSVVYSKRSGETTTDVLKLDDSGNVAVNGSLSPSNSTVKWTAGAGAPAFASPIGSIYSRTDGGAGTSLYVNETGLAGGWVAK